MAKVRLKWNQPAFVAIDTAPKALELVRSKVDAIAAACNEQSSWGGYASGAAIHPDRVRGTVWSFDNRVDEARDNRMIRNLDA
ncbi:MAG TPA: hypothetical protein VGM94_09510 [Galbitalea sp.]|jgi:hypothetical protein